MSNLIEQEIACPFCKHPFQAEIWSSVNAQEDPELKDIILGGEMNMVECEACKKVFYADGFMLYHDPANELMVFVYPFGHREERARWEEKTKTDFRETESSATDEQKIKYEPVSAFGMDELVRLVEREEEVSIQGEIVSHLSKEHGFSVRQIKPSLARRHNLPKILPFSKDPRLSFRDSVLNALSALEAINNHLFIYNETRKLMMDNPNLAADFSE